MTRDDAVSLPSLCAVVTAAFRYRRMILLSFALPPLASLALAFLLPAAYQADAKVLVRSGREYLAQLEMVQGGGALPPSSTMQETVDTEIEILNSQDLTREVIDHLTIARLYPDLADDPPRDMSLEEAAVRQFQKDLRIEPVKLSNVIAIGLRNADKALAVTALADLLARFQERHVAAFRHRGSSLLETQMASDSAELAQVEQLRAAAQNRTGLFDAAAQRAALIAQQTKDADALRAARIDAAALTRQVAFLTAQLAAQPATITQQTTVQESPLVQDNEKHLRDLREQEAQLRTQYPAESRLVAPVRAALAAAETAETRGHGHSSTVQSGLNPLAIAMRTQLLQAGASLAPVAARIELLQTALDEDAANLRRNGADAATLADLNRRIDQLTLSTATLRQHLTDARFLEDLDRAHVASLQVIEQPTAQPKPAFPKKSLFLAGGMVAGVLSAIGALLAALTFGNPFLDARAAERLVGAPLLLVLPEPPAGRNRAAGPAPVPSREPR